MKRPLALAAALLVLLLLVPAFVATAAASSSAATPATSSIPVTGSITGPTVVATGSTSVFRIYGYGGPAVATNGSVIGNITYYALPVGPNLTGVDFTPSSTTVLNNKSVVANLVAGNSSETISIDVMISSTYQGKNESTNLTYSVSIVQPYVVSATIVNPSNFTVSAFTLYVTLDGAVVGQVNVSSLISGGSYKVSFKYATLGLSPGDHTFALSLVQEHGLVTFANGATRTPTLPTVIVTFDQPTPPFASWTVRLAWYVPVAL